MTRKFCRFKIVSTYSPSPELHIGLPGADNKGVVAPACHGRPFLFGAEESPCIMGCHAGSHDLASIVSIYIYTLYIYTLYIYILFNPLPGNTQVFKLRLLPGGTQVFG